MQQMATLFLKYIYKLSYKIGWKIGEDGSM
jgi:hypothetical protein